MQINIKSVQSCILAVLALAAAWLPSAAQAQVNESILPTMYQTNWQNAGIYGPGLPGPCITGGIPADNDPCRPATVWIPDGNPYGGYSVDPSLTEPTNAASFTTAFQGAINSACAAATPMNRQIVFLAPGAYFVNQQTFPNGTPGGIYVQCDNVTIRGSGATTTSLVANQFINGYGALIFFGNRTGTTDAPFNLQNVTTDALKGSTTIQVADASGFMVGDVITIDHEDGPAAPDSVGGAAEFNGGYLWFYDSQYFKRQPSANCPNFCPYIGPVNNDGAMPIGDVTDLPSANQNAINIVPLWRSTQQEDVITAISGNTLTVQDTLNIDFPASLSPQVWRTVPQNTASGPLGNQWDGLENIRVAGGNDNFGFPSGDIDLNFMAYSWIENVDADGENWQSDSVNHPNKKGYNIALGRCYRCQVTGSYVHGSYCDPNNPNTNEQYCLEDSADDAYGIVVSAGSSQDLVDNNISIYNNKPVNLINSGGGNVIAYNYVDESELYSTLSWQESSIDDSHNSFTHNDLIEGNWAANLGDDGTHGNEGWDTHFRNYSNGVNSLSAAAFTGLSGPKTDNLRAVNQGGYAHFMAYVGNVLQGGTVYQVNDGSPSSGTPIYQIGFLGGNIGYDDGYALQHIYRDGNWDNVTNGIVWNNGPETIPPSFYLTSAPAYFNGFTWPWVNPLTGTTSTLPAKARYGSGNPIPPTFSASPTAVAPGGQVTVSWSGVSSPVSWGANTAAGWNGSSSPTVNDYIGGPGVPAQYTSSCSGTPGSTAESSGSCMFTMPTTPGTVLLSLFPNGGQTPLASVAVMVNEAAPQLTSISPSSGAAGTLVTLTGSNLSGATSVTFGTTPVTPDSSSSTSVTATAPAGSGAVSVTVTTPIGTSNGETFTYTAAGFTYTLANGGNLSVAQGSSAPQTVTATLTGGTAQSVSYAVSGLPTGANLSFPACTPTCTSTGTVTTTSSTPAGAYTVTVTGAPNNVTTSFTLTVKSAGGGGIRFIQTVQTLNRNRTPSFTSNSITTSSGDLLVAALSMWSQNSTPTTISSITLDGTTSFTVDKQQLVTSNNQQVIVIASLPNVAAGTHTVTVTANGNITVGSTLFVSEFSGAALASPEDGTGAASSPANWGTTPASGTFTTTASNDLWVAAFTGDGTTTSLTPGTGWTVPANGANLTSNNGDPQSGFEYLIANGQTSGDGSFTLTSNVNWAAAAIAYKASSGPPPFTYTLANGGNISVAQGSSAPQTVTATLTGGTAQSVSYAVSGLPSGASLSFPACTPTCTSTGTVTTTSSTPAGAYPITVTGAPNNVTTSFTLTVKSAGGGGIRFIQTVQTLNRNRTPSFTSKNITTSSGDLLVAAVALWSVNPAPPTISSITLDGTTSFTVNQQLVSVSNQQQIVIASLPNVAAGTHTVTVTANGNISVGSTLFVSEFSGAALASPVDGTGASATAYGSNPASGTFTTSASNDLWVSAFTGDTTNTSLTPATGWTIPANGAALSSGNGTPAAGFEYLLANGQTSGDGSFTLTSTPHWAAAAIAYKSQ